VSKRRHICAKLLLTKGVHPKIVPEMLGHSSIAITLDTCSHMVPGLGDVADRAMEGNSYLRPQFMGGRGVFLASPL
jgi:hypothetical protein